MTRLDRGVRFGIRALCAILVVSAVGLSWRGLGLGDEGYLLSLVAHPDAARPAGEVFTYGYLLHPLWELCGEDVVRYRLAGWILLFAATALTARETWAACGRPGTVGGDRLTPWLLSLAASTLAMGFAVWVLAYKGVVLIGLLLATTGLARLERGRPTQAGALVGIGAVLVLSGRPPAVPALGLVVLAYLGWARAAGWGRFLAGAVGAGVAGVALQLALARMTPADLVAFYSGGVAQVRLTGGYASLASLVGWRLPEVRSLLLLGPVLLVPALIAVLRTESRSGGSGGAEAGPGWGWWVLLVAGAVACAWRVQASFVGSSQGALARPLGWTIPLLVIALLLARGRRGRRLSAPRTRLVTLLLVMPYLSVVGSNSDFVEQMPLSVVFWVLALGLVVGWDERIGGTAPTVRLVSLAMAALALAVPRYADLVDGPFTAQLAHADTAVDLRYGRVWVRPVDAEALSAIDRVRRAEGIREDTPVLDLTGVSFGYELYLGGRPLGRAGFFSLYDAPSTASAAYALDRETCADRARAIVLYADDNPGDLSPVWTGLGFDLRRDYVDVGSFRAEQAPAGWAHLDVHILRPRPDLAATAGCPS